jgi:class 3 adenylate cyclase
MEPRIQYAKTTDGVNIAYSVIGDGDWLVYPSNVWGDLRWYLHDEATQSSIDALAACGWRIIRYDGRGKGASDRDVADFSLESRIRDLEAVIAAAGAERFVACGYGHGGPPAIMYAIRHSERVSHLILVNTYAVGSEYYAKIPAMRALMSLREMAESEWEFFTMTFASANTSFQDVAVANKTAAMFRGSMSASAFLSFVKASNEIDVTGVLGNLRVPTLVVEDSSGLATGDLLRSIAVTIPGARFVSTDSYIGELHAFVTGHVLESAQEEAPRPISQGMTAILFADIVESTTLTERLGDVAFREKARDLDAALRTVIRDHGGTPIEGKLLGDGVLATFASARQAIEAALACGKAGDDADLALHLGLHAGDVLRESDPDGRDNVYGGAVNVAARISGLSAPGEVLVSQTVRDLARTSAGVAFEDRGEQALKGVGEPVRVWAVVSARLPDGQESRSE